MRELIAVALGFTYLVILLRRRVNFGLTTATASLLIWCLSGQPLLGFFGVLEGAFTSGSTWNTLLCVFMITLLGGICGRYGTLTQVVESLDKLIPNPRVVLMLIPALIGLLTLPGGAVLSIPFVASIGERLEISKSRMAAINLSFRHMGSMCLPFAPPVLLCVALMPQLNLYSILGMNFLFMCLNVLMGYLTLVRPIPYTKADVPVDSVQRRKALRTFIINLSPIYVSVLLNLLLRLPLYLCAGLGILLTYLISDRSDFWGKLKASLKLNIVYTMAGVILLQHTIQRLTGLSAIIGDLLGSGVVMAVVVLAVAAWFFGIITGQASASMGIMLPILTALLAARNADLAATLYYTFVIFIGSYLGYYFSPLHLCQVFTLEYLRISAGELYREYRGYAPSVLLAAIALFVILGFVML